MKMFYCYSRPLNLFLQENGEKCILHSVHEKTQKKFWVFERTDRLNSLLDKWRLNKDKD